MTKSKKYKEYWKSFEDFNNFTNKYVEYKKNGKFKITKDFPLDKLTELWKDIFIKCLLLWGFNKKSTEMLFQWGNMGHNWKLLWNPTDDKNKENKFLDEYRTNIQETFNSFQGEVFYCSDRMHDDRLFRCHWEYNNFVRQFKKKFKK